MSTTWTALAAIGSSLAGIGALVGGIAVAWTAFYKAPKAFDEWKARERFRADRERAIDILATAHEAQMVFNAIRSPASFGYEHDAAKKVLEDDSNLLPLTPAEQQRHEQRVVTLTRINQHAEFWQKVYRLLPVAQAVFGEDVRDSLFSIIQLRQKVLVGAQMYSENDDPKALRRYEARFWQGAGEGDDEIDKELDKAADHLKQRLTPHIS